MSLNFTQERIDNDYLLSITLGNGTLPFTDGVFSGTLSVAGMTSLNGGITSLTGSRTLGATTISALTATDITTNTLTATGLSTLNSITSLSGTRTFGATTIGNITGTNATFSGTLQAAGLTTLTGGLTSIVGSNTLGTTTISALTSTSISTGTLNATGATTLNGLTNIGSTTLGLTTISTLTATTGNFTTLNVSGTSTLATVNATSGSFSSNLSVAGVATLNGGITSTAGTCTFGTTTISSLSGTSASFTGNLDVLGNTTLNNLTVTGLLAFGNIVSNIITGSTLPAGTLTLRSTTDTVKGSVIVDETTASTSVTTGAFKVAGGVGIAGALFATSGNFTSLVGPHGTLTGLLNDDHTQYALLAGRTGGQILTGGSAASNTLTLRSTSNATKGSILIDENTASTSTTTGALVVSGGVGITGSLYAGLIVDPILQNTATANTGSDIAMFRNAGGSDRISIIDERATGAFPPGMKSVANNGLGFFSSGTGPINFYTTSSRTLGLSIGNNSVVNIPNLTASQAVFTDGSRNLVSVATNGTGNVVLTTSPTLVTPNIGAATGTSLTTTSKVSIGGTEPLNLGRLFVTGTNENATNGPHLSYYTAANNFPLFQQLNWKHDDIALSFDMYYDGNWKKADVSIAYQIYKRNNELSFIYTADQVAGTNVDSLRTTGMKMDGNGLITLGSTTGATVSATGVLTIANATDATSSTNGGSTTIAGGLAVAKKLYVGTDLIVGGTITLTSLITPIITGSTAPAGTLTLRSTTDATKGTVLIDEVTESTSINSGALQVDGGVGIAKQLYIGGNTYVNGDNRAFVVDDNTGKRLGIVKKAAGGPFFATGSAVPFNFKIADNVDIDNVAATTYTNLASISTAGNLTLTGYIVNPILQNTATANTGSDIAMFRNAGSNDRISIIDETSTGSFPPGMKSVAGFGLGFYSSGTGPINFYTTASRTLGLSIANNSVVTIPNLTASQAVFTDGSKNLVSVGTTGTGNVVLANAATITNPTISGAILTSPNIGNATATSLNITGLTASQAVFTDASKNLVSVGTTGTGNVVLANAATITNPTISGPILISPNIGNATATSLIITGLTASQVVFTDATKNLISVGTTGTGNVVLATAATITNPTISGAVLISPDIGNATGSSLNLSGLNASQAVFTDGSKNLISVSTTGSGSVVLATSPNLTTPNIGAASASSLNISGLTASQVVFTDGAKNLVSVGTTGTGNVVLASNASLISPTLTTPDIGAATGTSLNLSGLTASQAVFTDGSKNLVSIGTNGTGNVVLTTSPTLVTPNIGAATASTITTTDRVSIGGTSPINIGKLFIRGGNNTVSTGPHIVCMTSFDDFPTSQLLNMTHDNIMLGFDMYYDGAFKTSSNTPGYNIYKLNSELLFQYTTTTPTAGGTTTRANAIKIDGTGLLTLGATTSATISSAGVLTIANTTDATSSTNGGATTILGGLAVAKKLYVGTDLSVGGTLSISSLVTPLITGSTAPSGTLTLRSTTDTTKGAVLIDEVTESTSTTSGALQLSGGAGIAKQLYVGGNTYVNGDDRALVVDDNIGKRLGLIKKAGAPPFIGIGSASSVEFKVADNVAVDNVATTTYSTIATITPTGNLIIPGQYINPVLQNTAVGNTGSDIAIFRNSAGSERLYVVDETAIGAFPAGLRTNAGFGLGYYSNGTGGHVFYTTSSNTARMAIANNGELTVFNLSTFLGGLTSTAGATTLGTTTATTITTSGKVSIGGADPLNLGRLFVTGSNGNATTGPHTSYYTAANNFPLFQQLNWTHDDIALSFDVYYDGAWKKADATVGYQIYKRSGELSFLYTGTEAAGTNIDSLRTTGMKMNGSGLITLGSTTGATITSAGVLNIANTTDATSSTNGGSTTILGGLAVAKKAYIGTDLNAGTSISLNNSKGSITSVTRMNSIGNMLNSTTAGTAITTDLKVINKRAKTSTYNAERAVSSWYSRTNIANRYWTGIAWSSKLSMFVAVNQSASIGATSYSTDGINWSDISATGDATWTSIVWAPELSKFIVVADNPGGFGEYAMASDTSGIGTWNAGVSLNAGAWRSVCWSSELQLAVAVGTSGTNTRIAITSNGVNWSFVSFSPQINWQAVCWSPELSIFVATGGSGQVMTSPDGSNWTLRSTSSTNSYRSVCWSPELYLFVAVGNSGTVFTSPDGITWTERSAASAAPWKSVKWIPELSCFVAIPENSADVMYSYNGIDWSLKALSASNFWQDFDWSPELSIMCAVSRNIGPVLSTTSIPALPNSRSSLLTNPSHVTISPDTGAVTMANTLSVTGAVTMADTLSVTGASTFGTSVDLTNSTKSITSITRLNSIGRMINSTSAGTAITTDMKVMNKRLRTSNANATAATSTWFARDIANSEIYPSICWSPEVSRFVTVFASGANNSVRYSSNGVEWNIGTVTSSASWQAVCWAPEISRFIAVAASAGSGVASMYSSDGASWTTSTSLDAANTWSNVCWSSELQLAVATSVNGTNRIATSTDGINWTARTAAAANQWMSVCWSPELRIFVAVAQSGTGNRVMTSTDGANWTSRNASSDSVSWASVCWSSELYLFVAVGLSGTTGCIMTSPDGITWTTRNAPGNNALNSVCWSPDLSIFVAVANGSYSDDLVTSFDGITWTGRAAPLTHNWSSVCWSPELSIFCASAVSGTHRIMTSAPGIPNSRSVALINPVNIAYTNKGEPIYKNPILGCTGSNGSMAAFQDSTNNDKVVILDRLGKTPIIGAPSSLGLTIGIDTGNMFFTRSYLSTEDQMFSLQSSNGQATFNYNVVIVGSITKGSGTFDIPHPIPEKEAQGYRLRHSFVESNNAGDNLYRYTVTTENLKAEIELPDYFDYLNENPQVFITAQDVFGFSKAIVKNGKVLIDVSNDGVYNVLVIGTRKDRVGLEGWNSKGGVEYIPK